MAITNKEAWLERPWLERQWLGTEIEDSTATQVELRVDTSKINNAQTELRIDVLGLNNAQTERRIDTEATINAEVERRIDVIENINAQVERRIDVIEPINTQVERRIDLEEAVNTQVEMGLSVQDVSNSQVEMSIIDALNTNNAQSTPTIDVLNNLRAETERVIIDALKQNGAQVELKIDQFKVVGGQVYSSNIYYVLCEGWLEDPWLTKAWLTKKLCASARTQVELRIDTHLATGAQVELFIEDQTALNYSQVEMRIDVETPIGAQVETQFITAIPSQVLIALYNTSRPRILCEFPSRGISGQNWVASDTMAGDFSVLNINNDISEHYWRSNDGITTATLTCDTEVSQGIFLDTFYVENHNFTRSAVVILEASNDSGFSPVEKTINLTVSDEKIYYIEPTLPVTSYRYWRLRISDPGNSDNFLRIGVVVFGAANILNSECTTQDIIVAPREFKNAVPTEGFTSVANSRSLKRSIKLNFLKISYDSGDYDTLNDVINYSRTTLKCLWIPDPRSTSLMERFAVFGKIKQIPQQRHNVKGINENMDFIDFNIEIDEAT